MTLAQKWNSMIDYIINEVKSIPELADDVTDNSMNTSSNVLIDGTVIAVPFTGLQPGEFIDSFDIEVVTPVGVVRGKVYDDLNGAPNALLGETDSIEAVTGIMNLMLQKQVEIPQDGLIWIALENDDSQLIVKLVEGLNPGEAYSVLHTYGEGPTSFGGSASTTAFWAQIHRNPSVVKFYGIRGSAIEDFFAIVSPADMTVVATTNRGSDNEFKFAIDLSFRGTDFQYGCSQILDMASQIYDKLHMTTLRNRVRSAKVEIYPDEILEGEKLYLIGARILITAQRLIVQN